MTIAFPLVPVTLASALTCGALLALVGSLQQPLAERLNLGNSRLANLLMILHLVLIPFLPLAGALVDQVGVEPGLIAGSLLAALGLSMLAVREHTATSIAMVLLTGAAAACLSVAVMVVLPAVLFAGAQSVAAVNLGFIAVGLGSVLVPAVFSPLLQALRWRRTLLLLALFCLVPALAAALTPGGEFPEDRAHDPARVLGNPALWLAGLICLFYLPVEGAIIRWTTTKLAVLGYSARQVVGLQIGFWTGLFLARLAAALFFLAGWVRPGTEPWFLFGIGLCLSMALGNLAGAGRRESISWGVLAVGFACGPFFPTLIGVVLTRFSEDAGTAVGTLLGLGALGNLVLTPLLRWHDASPTAQRGLIMPLLLSLLVALAAMVLGVAS